MKDLTPEHRKKILIEIITLALFMLAAYLFFDIFLRTALNAILTNMVKENFSRKAIFLGIATLVMMFPAWLFIRSATRTMRLSTELISIIIHGDEDALDKKLKHLDIIADKDFFEDQKNRIKKRIRTTIYLMFLFLMMELVLRITSRHNTFYIERKYSLGFFIIIFVLSEILNRFLESNYKRNSKSS